MSPPPPARLPQPSAPPPHALSSAVAGEQRSTPVELLWDLVFAFAITQVTTLLAGSLSWGEVARALLVLALVWWAWSAFVWAANAVDPLGPTLRQVLLPATCAVFIAAVVLPHAYGRGAVLFSVAYVSVRLLHLALYAEAARRGSASRAAIAGFAITVAVGMALLLAGAFIGGTPQVALWILAAAIDYAGPGWLTRERLRGLQQVAVAHFAERYSLFVIICLGESIVSVGAAAVGGGQAGARRLTPGLVAAVGCCLLITVGLWWAYFERAAQAAERRLLASRDPVLTAADAYSYLHLLIVAGIILAAVGGRLLIARSADAAVASPVRWTLCAGVAVYLLGHLAFCLRLGGRPSPVRLGAVAVALILAALSGGWRGWELAAAVAIVLAAMGTLEAGARFTVLPVAGALREEPPEA